MFIKLIWLIPVLPLLGSFINGIVGRKRFSKPVVAAVANTTVFISFAIMILAVIQLAGLPVELWQMPDELSKKVITVRFDDLRLDALLDILCHEQGIRWRTTDRETVELRQ